MLKKIVAIGFALLLTSAARPAWATTITFDFEGFSTATSVSSVATTVSGLTATLHRLDNAASMRVLNLTLFGGSPASFQTRSIDAGSGSGADYTSPGSTLVINFSASISSGSIQFGDYGADDDSNVVLTAFSGLNGSGATLASSSIGYPSSLNIFNGDADVRSLTFAAAGIQSLTITGGGTVPNSLFYDNLIVNTTDAPAAVPEPTSLFLLGTGLVATRRLVKRRSR